MSVCILISTDHNGIDLDNKRELISNIFAKVQHAVYKYTPFYIYLFFLYLSYFYYLQLFLHVVLSSANYIY